MSVGTRPWLYVARRLHMLAYYPCNSRIHQFSELPLSGLPKHKSCRSPIRSAFYGRFIQYYRPKKGRSEVVTGLGYKLL